MKKFSLFFLVIYGLVFASNLIKAQDVKVEEVFARIEVVRTPIPLNFQTNKIIEQYVAYYQVRGRQTMETMLSRSTLHKKMIQRIFNEEGVPGDLFWISPVETIWAGGTRSWTSVRPIWIFLPETAKKYGLRRTKFIDETQSFEKATRATAQYLKFLYERYDKNWEIALGAYYSGIGNVDFAIRKAKVKDYWKIYQYLPRETKNFVPNVLATILIAKDKQKYGFEKVLSKPALEYELVRIPPSVSLERVAEYSGTDLKSIRFINPELIANITPPEIYIIRVPLGSGQIFAQKMRKLLSR